MIDMIRNFLHMGGYGTYIFCAYGCVLLGLFLPWLIVWRRFRKYCAQRM